MKNIDCATLPSVVATFVDTFIDFTVSGGIFLLPNPQHRLHLKTFFPQPTRLIAIGDLHGDLSKAKQALQLANLIDSNNKWIGGTSTVVQVGDIFDRGGDEIKLLYLFEKLKREAAKSGGQVITMNGNHEIMNIDGDFSFASPSGVKEFENWGMWQQIGCSMKKMSGGVVDRDLFDEMPEKFLMIKPELQKGIRARFAAMRPNGLISNRFLSRNQTVVVVGDSVFAHGGLLRNHVLYGLERVNAEVRDWICGVKEDVENELVRTAKSIVWLRNFSNEKAEDCDCSMLKHVLETIPGVKRMIMGHTIQENGINGVCGNQAIRVDVGMSNGCGNGFPEVLQITENSEVRVLTSDPRKHLKAKRDYIRKKEGLGSLIPEERARQVEVNA